jgi:putative salt-induced outer membrane protein YdiY
MIRITVTTATALLALLPQQALAQEGDKPWKSSVELGYVSTDGNSETSTLKVRANAGYESERWRNDALIETLNAEEGGQRSAERYFGSNKLGYKFTESNYLFGYTSYEDDRFTGYDWQAVAAAGFGYRALENDSMLWDLEAGPGYRYSKVRNPDIADDEEELILRAYTHFEWKLSDSATFQQALSSEIGQDKTVSRSDTSIKSTIIGALAMKLSYTFRYTDNVPPGTRHADTETAVTLVYSF